MKNKILPIFFIILVSGVIFSCSRRPSNVLSEKKMVNLLVDMELAESYVNTQGSSSFQARIDLGEKVLAAHGVSEESLDTTLAWYGRNMDEYSALYEKVDKELEKRRKKYTEIPGEIIKNSDNLWPYPDHLILSPMSGFDSFIFSFNNPGIEKGDKIDFSFFLPNSVGLKTTIGVEYEEGKGEAISSNLSSKKKIELEFQTDTLLTVARIFGVMQVKDLKSLPLYIDSISFKTEPFDSLTYRTKRRSIKSFGSTL